MAIEGIGVTAGTTDIVAVDTVAGTSYQVIKVSTAADGSGGALWDGKVAVNAGTIDSMPNIPGGTINAATVSVNTPGTITSGSISVIAGTIGTVANVGKVHNAGTIAGGTISEITNGSIVVTAGTFSATIGDITGGTIDQITNGSIHVTAGTVALSSPGTITSGTVAINAGTVGGKAASGAVSSGNPIFAGGTDSGGTIHGVLTDTSGVLQINGTVSTGGAGTQVVRLVDGTLTSLSTLPDLPGGTVDVVSSLTNGSIHVTAGTFVHGSPGTITSGTVAINAGTIGGKAASGAASVANPVQIAGTDSGGTIYSPLINTSGAGTISGVGTVPGVGTIPGIGVVTTVTNLSNGTIQNSGTTTGIGVLSNLTNGSVHVTAGTEVITSGSITMTAGTIGTVTNVGQVYNAGTIQGGTININSTPTKSLITIGSTWGTSSGTAGTLIAAPGSGTHIYINDLTITNDGTTTLGAGVSFGTAQTGTAVVKKIGSMGANGGLQSSFPIPVGGHFSNTALVIYTLGSGTATFNVSYWTE